MLSLTYLLVHYLRKQTNIDSEDKKTALLTLL